MKAKAAVLEQIQDVTVIQPAPDISVEHVADNAVRSGEYVPCMNPQNSLCDEANRADLECLCTKSVYVSHTVCTSESLPSVLRTYTGIPITSSAKAEKHNRRRLNYIDAISANDMARRIEPILAMIDPYTKAAGPPFSHETWKLSARASHAACSVIMKLLIASVLM
jgi:hypothetical protein